MLQQNNGYLMHYGVKGQKWGVRRYQDEQNKLTAEGREHYGIGQQRSRFGFANAVSQTRQAISRATSSVKTQAQNKISEARGPKHMTDDELNARVNRLRKEAEYERLRREIEGGGNQNQGGGGKKGGGDKKHPYMSKALLMPIATAIGVGTSAIASEKVHAFLDRRATVKMKNLLNVAKSSTDQGILNKLIDSAGAALKTAGRDASGLPKATDIVNSNLFKQASSQAFKTASKGRSFIDTMASRRSPTNYIPHNRGHLFRTFHNTGGGSRLTDPKELQRYSDLVKDFYKNHPRRRRG